MVVSPQELPKVDKGVGVEGKETLQTVHSKSPESTKEKIGHLDPNRKDAEPNKIDLLTEEGIKFATAKYGPVTEPAMFQSHKINLENRAKDYAHAANKRLQEDGTDPAAIQKEIQDEITEEHLESVLHLVFLKFGGDVYSATDIGLNDGLSATKNIETKPGTGKLERNFIIPRSGAERMRGLLTGTIPVSLGEGVRFDVDPYYSDFIGKRGFTCVLEAKTPSGKEIKINVNFYYGREKGATEQNEEGKPVEVIEPDLALAA